MESSTTILRKNPARTPAQTLAKKPAKTAAPAGHGIKKEYLKSKNACKVTFKLPMIAVPSAAAVQIVGEFNNWDTQAHPMKRLKNGDYSITLDLETGKEYQYRYLIDQSRWENDFNADRYVKSPFGDCDNSVVSI